MSEQDSFSAQLKSDENKAFRNLEPDSPATQILRKLYPLLRGPLYPKGKASEIAELLETTIDKGKPVTLLAVIAPETAVKELPFFKRAIGILRSQCQSTATALIVDWPAKPVKTAPGTYLQPGAPLTEAVKATKDIRTFNLVQTITSIPDGTAIPEQDQDLKWLINYLLRQGTWGDNDYRVFGFLAREQLAARREIGRVISETPSDGLRLGLTTELNPGLLRCYGRNIYLANLKVK